ncbi:MAG: hypothetical protein PHQ60_16315 [Sideroxydans sp.]|nr:hypothetical protein [Sideroxydans sp.]
MQLTLIEIIISILMGLTLLAIILLIITFIKNYRHNKKTINQSMQMPKPQQSQGNSNSNKEKQIALSQVTKDLNSANMFCKKNKINPDYIIIIWMEEY